MILSEEKFISEIRNIANQISAEHEGLGGESWIDWGDFFEDLEGFHEEHVVMKKEDFISWLKKLRIFNEDGLTLTLNKFINQIENKLQFQVGKHYKYSITGKQAGVCKCVHKEDDVFFFWDFKSNTPFTSNSERFEYFTFEETIEK